MASGLPDFRELVLNIYKKLDSRLHEEMLKQSSLPCQCKPTFDSDLIPEQVVELRNFLNGQYDTTLGMLERRFDDNSRLTTKVRSTIQEIIRDSKNGDGTKATPAAIHKSLIRLADRGNASAIVTTNFDYLLEDAAKNQKKKLNTFSLDGIVRPSYREDFAGILHIHGIVDPSPTKPSSFVVTDHDFGEYYFRRRVITDFVYDAARLFHIVLVGYSANDPPMRYLLNAISADSTKFSELKPRYALIGSKNACAIQRAEWQGRGITPIQYQDADDHRALSDLLQRWASLSPINGDIKSFERLLGRICKNPPSDSEAWRSDVFRYLFRCETRSTIRRAWATALAKKSVDLKWLDILVDVIRGRESSEAPS